MQLTSRRRVRRGLIHLSRFVLIFSAAASCFAQSASDRGEARTAGKCSPAILGNNNRVTINCQCLAPDCLDTELSVFMQRLRVQEAADELELA